MTNALQNMPHATGLERETIFISTKMALLTELTALPQLETAHGNQKLLQARVRKDPVVRAFPNLAKTQHRVPPSNAHCPNAILFI